MSSSLQPETDKSIEAPRIMEESSTPDPQTDETGEVDLSLIDYSLSLTLEERTRRHYHARIFAERMRHIARQRYGSIIDDLKTAE